MTIKELREMTGLSQKRFADFLGIPVRTIQNWETGVNQCADYLVSLIEYKLKNEGIIQ